MKARITKPREVIRRLEMILLTGWSGGGSNDIAQHKLNIDSAKTATIQGVQVLILHLISERIEELFKNKVRESGLIS